MPNVATRGFWARIQLVFDWVSIKTRDNQVRGAAEDCKLPKAKSAILQHNELYLHGLEAIFVGFNLHFFALDLRAMLER
jgi:hypothetical protein